MSKLQVIAICTIATVLAYLVVTEYLPRIGMGDQSITEPQHHGIEIIHQGYGEEYGSTAADMELSDIGRVEEAFELIERYSPQDYEMVINYVDVIELIPISFEMHQSHIFSSQKRMRLVVGAEYCYMYCDEPFGFDLTWASVIVHEACHSMRYHTGEESALKYGEGLEYSMEEEEACGGMQDDFIERVAPKLSAEEAM